MSAKARAVHRRAAVDGFLARSIGRETNLPIPGTQPSAKALATKYDLTYLVIDRDIDLPLAYRNTRFRVYALKHE